jgi:hypothetical protein
VPRFFLILFFLPLHLPAQDITGIWTGYLEAAGSKLPFELAISGGGKENFTGYSHTTFTFNGVDNIGVKTIELKNKKGNVSLEDGELVFSNYTTPPRRVKMIGKMFLRTSDSMLVLNGSFFTRTIDFREPDKTSFTGTIYLRKQKGFPQTKLIAKLEEIGLLHTLSFAPEQYKKKEEPAIAVVNKTPEALLKKENTAVLQETETKNIAKSKQKPKATEEKKEADKKTELPVNKNSVAAITTPQINKAAASISKRKTEVIRNVFFTSDSLVLSLYDNGTIDGDTVSVVLNGEVIIAKKGLSENAIRTTIHLTPDKGDSLQLVMYAENLGTIPPNTGVLIVQDGNNRNEIRFAGDMQKSSAVILKRKR